MVGVSFIDRFFIQLTVDTSNCLSVVYVIVFDIIKVESTILKMMEET